MIIKANNSSDERFFPAITKRPKKIILIKKGNKKQIYSTQDLRSKKNKQIKERGVNQSHIIIYMWLIFKITFSKKKQYLKSRNHLKEINHVTFKKAL